MILHLLFADPNFLKHVPADLLQYLENPSTKINVLIILLKHHMQQPGAIPLLAYDVPNSQGESISELRETPELVPATAPPANGTPDKIVVYLAFPEHLDYILPVSPHDTTLM
jgi:hypothetical protein